MRALPPSVVVAEAAGWIGTPYRHQGSRKGVGCDCLGLIRGVWRALVGREPEAAGPYAPDWSDPEGERMLVAARRYMIDRGDAPPGAGDMILFRWRAHQGPRHAGIAVDAERFIHAYEGHAVTISALLPQTRRRIAGVFAFPDPSRTAE